LISGTLKIHTVAYTVSVHLNEIGIFFGTVPLNVCGCACFIFRPAVLLLHIKSGCFYTNSWWFNKFTSATISCS